MMDNLPNSRKQKEKVNLVIQVLLVVFVPFVGLYAFYRIRKLILGIIVMIGGFGASMGLQMVVPWPYDLYVAIPIYVVLPLILIIKWSMDWNKSIEN